MTAVIGLLNKHGVALAADSAVTRTKGPDMKVTKNGNKMVRLSDSVPVSVMITGNANFIGNPWDVVVRKFRQERRDVRFSTVEASVLEFMQYLSDTESLWDPVLERSWISGRIDSFLQRLLLSLDFEVIKTDAQGQLCNPRLFVKETIKSLKASQLHFASGNAGFKDYDFEEFKSFLRPDLEDCLKYNHRDMFDSELKDALMEHMDEIGEYLYEGLYASLTSTRCSESATLVFAGYGRDETFPSLFAVDVCGGFCRRVNWSIARMVRIDEETHAAICPFGQTDVVDALLGGASESWMDEADRYMDFLYDPYALLEVAYQEDSPDEIINLSEVSSDFSGRRRRAMKKEIKKNYAGWVKAMENADVRSMADLAHTLIELTGLHRILTFLQEGVGGDIDLAVITKTDGFAWLNRKSWYHHKDINGRYGPMGI